jgi:small subunit ribosomal protein S3Ae
MRLVFECLYPVFLLHLPVLHGLLFYSVDPFSKKDWYDVKAPSMFAVRQIGKTLVTRTQGTSK